VFFGFGGGEGTSETAVVVSFIPELSLPPLIFSEYQVVDRPALEEMSGEPPLLARMEGPEGLVPLLDLPVFLSQFGDGSSRREGMLEILGRIRESARDLRSMLRVSEDELYQKRLSAKRTRRKKHRYHRMLSLVTTIESRVAIFLIVLIVLSMFGVIAFEKSRNPGFESLWDTLWYSVVTITTVGYGDKTPITIGGKLVGLLLMGIGVIVMAAVTGRFASFLVDQEIRRREGMLKLKTLQNHFVICGWRKELDRVVEGILAVNPEYHVEDIVLINNVGHEVMQSVLNKPELKGLRYINGDYIEEETLRRASIEKAARVIVLADFSRDYSQQEVDSRTVMAVLTIESLTKRVYVAAELLDEKFEKYLKLAHCDEIILSREYSKMILANASAASGVSHVLEELLSPAYGRGLEIKEIPEEFIGRSFGRLGDYFNLKFGSICIGVLENTGNFYSRKKEALNEAQMTPDISKLVENLRSVKQLVPNHPVINPGRSYVVKKNSRAIVIALKDLHLEEVG